MAPGHKPARVCTSRSPFFVSVVTVATSVCTCSRSCEVVVFCMQRAKTTCNLLGLPCKSTCSQTERSWTKWLQTFPKGTLLSLGSSVIQLFVADRGIRFTLVGTDVADSVCCPGLDGHYCLRSITNWSFVSSRSKSLRKSVYCGTSII